MTYGIIISVPGYLDEYSEKKLQVAFNNKFLLILSEESVHPTWMIFFIVWLGLSWSCTWNFRLTKRIFSRPFHLHRPRPRPFNYFLQLFSVQKPMPPFTFSCIYSLWIDPVKYIFLSKIDIKFDNKKRVQFLLVSFCRGRHSNLGVNAVPSCTAAAGWDIWSSSRGGNAQNWVKLRFCSVRCSHLRFRILD